MATIQEIAKLAGVSVKTVTRAYKTDGVINAEKRKMILDLAEQYDYKPNYIAGRLSSKQIKISIIICNLINDFTMELMKGFNEISQKLEPLKVYTDIKVIDYSDDFIKSFASVIDSLDNDYKGVIVSIPVFDCEMIDLLNRLKEKGMIVITVNNRDDNINANFSVMNNTALAGKMASEIIKLTASDKNNAIFTGSVKSIIHSSILENYINEAKSGGINVCEVYDTNDNPLTAQHMIVDLLDKHPDIGSIYITSANSVPIINEICRRNLGGKIKVVATDIFPQMCEYLENGSVCATIYQNPPEQAFRAVNELYRLIVENVQIPKLIEINPIILLKSNYKIYL